MLDVSVFRFLDIMDWKLQSMDFEHHVIWRLQTHRAQPLYSLDFLAFLPLGAAAPALERLIPLVMPNAACFGAS